MITVTISYAISGSIALSCMFIGMCILAYRTGYDKGRMFERLRSIKSMSQNYYMRERS